MWFIIYYLLSHKDNKIISTNNPVTPPVKNEPTKAEILVITSIPNQPEPKITVDRIESDKEKLHQERQKVFGLGAIWQRKWG